MITIIVNKITKIEKESKALI